jgi:hypothetical protein
LLRTGGPYWPADLTSSVEDCSGSWMPPVSAQIYTTNLCRYGIGYMLSICSSCAPHYNMMPALSRPCLLVCGLALEIPVMKCRNGGSDVLSDKV